MRFDDGENRISTKDAVGVPEDSYPKGHFLGQARAIRTGRVWLLGRVVQVGPHLTQSGRLLAGALCLTQP